MRSDLGTPGEMATPIGADRGVSKHGNAFGRIVGSANGGGSTTTRPLRWINGVPAHLFPSDLRQGTGTQVSEDNRVVGFIRENNLDRAYWVDPGSQTYDFLLPDDTSTRATAIGRTQSSLIGGSVLSGGSIVPAYWVPSGSVYGTAQFLPGWAVGRQGTVIGVSGNRVVGAMEPSGSLLGQTFVYTLGDASVTFLDSRYGRPAQFDRVGETFVGNGPVPYLWLGAFQPNGGAAIDLRAFCEPATDTSNLAVSGISEATPPRFGGSSSDQLEVFFATGSSAFTRRVPSVAGDFSVVNGTLQFGNFTDVRFPDAAWANVRRATGLVPAGPPVLVEVEALVSGSPQELWFRSTVRVDASGLFDVGLELWDFQALAWVVVTPAESRVARHYLTFEGAAPGELARFVSGGKVRGRLSAKSTGPVSSTWSIDVEQANFYTR